MNYLKPSKLADVLGVGKSCISNAMQSRNGNPAKLIFKVINGEKLIDINDKYNRIYIDETCQRRGVSPDFMAIFDISKKNAPTKNIKDKKTTPAKNIKEVKTASVKNVKEVKNIELKITKEKKNENIKNENFDIDLEPESETELENELDEVDLFTQKKIWEIEKLKNNVEKERLQIEKIAGNLLPIDETSHVLNYVISNFIASSRSQFNNILSLAIKELGGNDEDYKRYVDVMENAIIDYSETAISELGEGIEDVVNQYTEVRGRGERK